MHVHTPRGHLRTWSSLSSSFELAYVQYLEPYNDISHDDHKDHNYTNIFSTKTFAQKSPFYIRQETFWPTDEQRLSNDIGGLL